MANPYAIKPIASVTSPNGIKIAIYSDGDKNFVKLSKIYKALGFTGQFGKDTTLALVFKNHRFTYFPKKTTDSQVTVYVIELNQVIPVLEAFIRITLTVKTSLYQALRDNARMEAQRLIEIFNREVFSKTENVITNPIETCKTKEDTQMENSKPTDNFVTNTPAQDTVSIVTATDIQDIGDRASYVAKVYGVSLKEALIAATKLKAAEINRDLSPLLEMLA